MLEAVDASEIARLREALAQAREQARRHAAEGGLEGPMAGVLHGGAGAGAGSGALHAGDNIRPVGKTVPALGAPGRAGEKYGEQGHPRPRPRPKARPKPKGPNSR